MKPDHRARRQDKIRREALVRRRYRATRRKCIPLSRENGTHAEDT